MSFKLNINTFVNVLGALIIVASISYGYVFVKSLDSRLAVDVHPNYLPVVVTRGDISISYVSPPTHIDISSVGLSIDVVPGYYNHSDESWTVSDNKANFATITSVPNPEFGNTYIYGHNRLNVFASLVRLAIGDEAVITNSDGKKFTYKLEIIEDVSQYDTSNLEYSEEPILTLQTCSGFWDQHRTIYIFDFISES